jgi:hypothetical protein
MREIDMYAKEFAKRYGMPDDLHIPIAARTIDAINKYIGNISEILAKSQSNKALLVNLDEPLYISKKSAAWKVNSSEIFYSIRQVWVHVDYTGYRIAYQKAFPELDLTNFVVDHIMNRRVAKLKGFDYLRIIPISREANSSSGNMTEKYAVEYHSSPRMKLLNSQNQASIQYADLADIVKMLDIKTGGTLQDGVNEGQKYLLEE